MLSALRPAISVFVALTLLTGVAYPLLVTGIGQLLFPGAANGSLIVAGGQARGSALIGQNFSDSKYFWGRLSATGPHPYNAGASSGSNYGPLHPALKDAAQARIEALRAAAPGNTAPIPVDLVTASGSGLDPHISPAAAAYQAQRVAAARQLPLAQVQALIDAHTEPGLLGFIGSPRVNVLMLNMALDESR
jgi:K+-transporting ATPase ATPase C chain